MKIAVKGATQSPMNAKKWLLELVCGHDVWVTAQRKPTAKTYPCSICVANTTTAVATSNDQLDAMVLQAVREGCLRSASIQRRLKLGPSVDKSLQRLRRRGLIMYDANGPASSSGWRIVEKGGT